ncbi:MAG: hydrogenase iron-sulfur subunit [Thermoanaerobaculaceae bacterium]|nr:hydrogenase iron-sulfur subunit [Thermoanaerobaculaceae bacterium]
MSSDKSGFEPRIVAFLCNWCSYTGADLAGTARMKYPANVRTIRVMCSGRVDAQFVMKAFAEGADAVLISGCHTPSDCHYQEGNFKALRRYYLLKKMLPQFGIEPERLRLEWISAAEGDKFQEVCTEYTEQIKKLGPSPVKKGVKNG